MKIGERNLCRGLPVSKIITLGIHQHSFRCVKGMPRQARLDSPGTLHHVIIRGIEKRRIIDNVKDQEAFVSRLGGIVKETKTAI
jgi:hypothetical protein